MFKVPKFSRPVSAVTSGRPRCPSRKIEELYDGDVPETHDVNKGWPLVAHFVPPLSGARTISIKAQPSPLQAVIKLAIREVTGDALFVTAYPSPVTIAGYYRGLLSKSASDLNLAALQDRLMNDHKFAEDISRIVRLFYLFICNLPSL